VIEFEGFYISQTADGFEEMGDLCIYGTGGRGQKLFSEFKKMGVNVSWLPE